MGTMKDKIAAFHSATDFIANRDGLQPERTSRFAVCMVGEGFSVEDRRTGGRVGWYRTERAARLAADEQSRVARCSK